MILLVRPSFSCFFSPRTPIANIGSPLDSVSATVLNRWLVGARRSPRAIRELADATVDGIARSFASEPPILQPVAFPDAES